MREVSTEGGEKTRQDRRDSEGPVGVGLMGRREKTKDAPGRGTVCAKMDEGRKGREKECKRPPGGIWTSVSQSVWKDNCRIRE